MKNVLIVGDASGDSFAKAEALREAGFTCDIAVADFYGLSGAPEWLAFDGGKQSLGAIGSHETPNWFVMPEADRIRPDWYVQGPLHQVISALVLRRRGETGRAKVAEYVLHYSRLKAALRGTTFPHTVVLTQAEFDEDTRQLNLSRDERLQMRYARQFDDIVARVRLAASKLYEPSVVGGISPPFAPGYIDAFFPFDAGLEGHVKLMRSLGLMFASGIEMYGEIPARDVPEVHGFDPKLLLGYGAASAMWQEVIALYDRVIFVGSAAAAAAVAGAGKAVVVDSRSGGLGLIPGDLCSAAYRDASLLAVSEPWHATDLAEAYQRKDSPAVWWPTLSRGQVAHAERKGGPLVLAPFWREWLAAPGGAAIFAAAFDKVNWSGQMRVEFFDWQDDQTRQLMASFAGKPYAGRIALTPALPTKQLREAAAAAHVFVGGFSPDRPVDHFALSILSSGTRVIAAVNKQCLKAWGAVPMLVASDEASLAAAINDAVNGLGSAKFGPNALTEWAEKHIVGRGAGHRLTSAIGF